MHSMTQVLMSKSVCYWHCLNTYYFRTNFVRVPGSFNSEHVKCMCSQNRHRFKVPSEWLSDKVQVPCLRAGITQQKLCFLLSCHNCASTVYLAPTRLPWPPRHFSKDYDTCTRSCCRGSIWVLLIGLSVRRLIHKAILCEWLLSATALSI